MPAWTLVVLDSPWLAALAWIILHSLDYYLTLASAVLYRRGVNQIIEFSGSYELNPVFQRAIDGGHWISRRFLVSLVLGGLFFWLLVWAMREPAAAEPMVRSIPAVLLGMLLFTRLTVIGQHLQSIWLFRRILRDPSAVRGHLVYDRATLLHLSAGRIAAVGGLLTVAALLAPSPWLWGGAVGHGLIALKMLQWGRWKMSQVNRHP